MNIEYIYMKFCKYYNPCNHCWSSQMIKHFLPKNFSLQKTSVIFVEKKKIKSFLLLISFDFIYVYIDIYNSKMFISLGNKSNKSKINGMESFLSWYWINCSSITLKRKIFDWIINCVYDYFCRLHWWFLCM